jgi:uncharacterized membrane protein
MMSKSRLESFSDGVMAIVITLLAFDLVVPLKGSANAALAFEALMGMRAQFLLFFISFITLSTMWINHHYIIGKIEEVRARVLWTNSFLLMFMTLVPFATTFLSKNPFNKISVMFYSLLMFVISYMFSRLYNYAKDHEFKTLFPTTRKLRHVGMTSYALAFFLSIFNPLFGYVFICIPLVVYILPRQ